LMGLRGAVMELFTKLFGDLLVFVYHCFDRIVIHGYLSGLSRPEQVVYFFRRVSPYPAGVTKIEPTASRRYPRWHWAITPGTRRMLGQPNPRRRGASGPRKRRKPYGSAATERRRERQVYRWQRKGTFQRFTECIRKGRTAQAEEGAESQLTFRKPTLDYSKHRAAR
jgi:hypothetical protein